MPVKVWAYCAQDWQQSTSVSAGIPSPVISPPAGTGLDLSEAAAADLVVLNLHGFAGQPHFYGQANGVIGPTALTVEDIIRREWSGVVVFAEVCFGLLSPIARAFHAGGAVFVGSRTEAYGRMHTTLWNGEADRLAHFFRLLYRPGRSVPAILVLAKRLLHVISLPLDEKDKSTLTSFGVYKP